ncbi:amino acid ABC transporter permease, partial [Streptomyces sp. SID5998]|nr:amino acid ABC transporter permease [Streptomyces sp. SID5998]
MSEPPGAVVSLDAAAKIPDPSAGAATGLAAGEPA